MPRIIKKAEVKRLVAAGAQLVDVLPKSEYFERHLPAAISLPLTELTAETAKWLDPDRAIIVYCNDDT